MATEKEIRTFMVLGHRIYLGEGGSFTTVRFGERCRRVKLQVLQNLQLRQGLQVIRLKVKRAKYRSSEVPKRIYTIDSRGGGGAGEVLTIGSVKYRSDLSNIHASGCESYIS